MSKEATKQLLAASFKELVVTNNRIEKITVQQITDKAGVIRSTFYNHFQDKYELLEWIIYDGLLEPIFPLFQGGYIKEGLILIFTNIKKEKEFYLHASRLEGQNSFSSITQELIQHILLEYIYSKVGQHAYYHSWMQPEMVAEYYARSIRFLIVKWMETGMELPPAEVATLCEKIFESNLEEIISEMK